MCKKVFPVVDMSVANEMSKAERYTVLWPAQTIMANPFQGIIHSLISKYTRINLLMDCRDIDPL